MYTYREQKSKYRKKIQKDGYHKYIKSRDQTIDTPKYFLMSFF